MPTVDVYLAVVHGEEDDGLSPLAEQARPRIQGEAAAPGEAQRLGRKPISGRSYHAYIRNVQKKLRVTNERYWEKIIVSWEMLCD